MSDDPYPDLRRDCERANGDYLKTYPDKETHEDVEEVSEQEEAPPRTDG
jgi:hypothetical protein